MRHRRVSQLLLSIAPQILFVVKDHAEHAETAVVPLRHQLTLRSDLTDQIRIFSAGIGVAGKSLLEVERMPRLDIDGAGDATLDHAGVLRQVDDRLSDHLGRQQVIAHTASDGLVLVFDEPVAGGHEMAIDGRLGQAVRCAAEADAVVVGESTLAGRGRRRVHARKRLQHVGHVLRRQLADVLGSGDLRHVRVYALGRNRRLDRVPRPGDDDLLQSRRIVRICLARITLPMP